MMMHVIVMFLLAMLVLPCLSYSRHAAVTERHHDGTVPVCLANLHAGVSCAPGQEEPQAMVLVRGQLLPSPGN